LEHVAPDDRDRQLEASRREAAELRSQLREKDALLIGLLAQAAHSERVDAGETVRDDPTERAIWQLDQRLFGGILSGAEVRDIEGAIKSAIRSFPNTVKSSVTCSTELCRLTIEGAESELAKGCGEVLEHLPKKFAGGIVLSEGDGRRAVFAATRRELLSTADPSVR